MAAKNFTNAVKEYLEDFKRKKYSKCAEQLPQLKILMTQIPSLPPVNEKTPQAQEEKILARDVLEHAVLLSVKLEDEESFERNYLQLQPYYSDERANLPLSDKEYLIVGLYLVLLMVQKRTAEFHTELELIPPEIQETDKFIRHAIQLEQWLMEGSYNKVLKAKDNLHTSEYYSYFIDKLASTVRDEIASCCEKAYDHLKLNDAKEVLMLDNDGDLQNFIEDKNLNDNSQMEIDDIDIEENERDTYIWKVENDEIRFCSERSDGGRTLSSMDVIKQTLVYAKELERIV